MSVSASPYHGKQGAGTLGLILNRVLRGADMRWCMVQSPFAHAILQSAASPGRDQPAVALIGQRKACGWRLGAFRWQHGLLRSSSAWTPS